MDRASAVEVNNNETYSYSWKIAFIYVFNLIVGAGALTLPKAFAETGLIAGTIALAILAIMSYCTSTFMIEAMSIANASLRLNRRQSTASNEYNEIDSSSPNEITAVNDHHDDRTPILDAYNDDDEDNVSLYNITTKLEMGEMANLFFHKIGLILYYVVISLYLYGDLAIYAAAVPKSLTTTVCGDTDIFNHDVTKSCKNVPAIRVIDIYRLMLVVFTATLCPFVFFNIGKTKFLQIFTTVFRWLSFLTMIILALVKIVNNKGTIKPAWFKFNQLPNFFGVAVYSFMCQHSLPSIITPVDKKKRINMVLLFDFASIASFYAVVALTAVFAFPVSEIEDLYTLNFTNPLFFRYFLELFPVFTLSTSFPIIGITLRENLKTLFLKNDGHYGLFVRSYLFPLITVIPPIAIAYFTYDVGMLVSITGSYAGAIIQYIIPVALVYCGRRHIQNTVGEYKNSFRSPFKSNFWIYFIVIWYLTCFGFVTVNMIRGK